ncbi:type II toxin-antitoxin system toxin ribonuclease C30 [soil metagenome]
MIAVDASALISIAEREPDALRHLDVLAATDEALIGQVNYLETGLILVRRGRFDGRSAFDHWLSELGVEIFDGEVSGQDALDAYLRWGRGFHRAGLNMGDCFAYALAKALDAPLLYKGDDFSRTDIRSALQPI